MTQHPASLTVRSHLHAGQKWMKTISPAENTLRLLLTKQPFPVQKQNVQTAAGLPVLLLSPAMPDN